MIRVGEISSQNPRSCLSAGATETMLLINLKRFFYAFSVVILILRPWTLSTIALHTLYTSSITYFIWSYRSGHALFRSFDNQLHCPVSIRRVIQKLITRTGDAKSGRQMTNLRVLLSPQTRFINPLCIQSWQSAFLLIHTCKWLTLTAVKSLVRCCQPHQYLPYF